jgi:hypothetical protein
MSLFRSSLFTLRIGEEDVSIGPSSIIASLLGVVDRAVDRQRATARSSLTSSTMREVSFSKARMALPMYCLQLMQNVDTEEQQRLRTSVDALGLVEMDEDLKSLNLGLLLMDIVGPAVLQAAVRDLGDRVHQ